MCDATGAKRAGRIPLLNIARGRRARETGSMKPDILALGAFPPAMKARMAELFTVHQFAPDGPFPPSDLSPEARARIRAIACEAHRGASGELIAGLPKLEIICCFGVGTDK